jgi:trans-aconitate methyltransferase
MGRPGEGQRDETGMTPPADAALAERLYALINAGWTTRAIAVAAQLRLAEALRASPQAAATLAEATHCDADALRRLLRALATLGLCDELDDGRFAITPLGEGLADDAPQSMRAWALQFGRQLWPAWGGLDEAVRSGKGLRERAGAADGFAHLRGDPEAAALFHRAMIEMTRIVGADAVRKIELPQARFFVDVGGGHGELLSAFLHRWPAARGVSLDLEHAADGATAHFAQQGLSARAGFVAGDFFIGIPAADVLLMKAILHDWNDARCALILGHARRGLREGGRLLVIDRVLPERMRDNARDRALARSDLTMLIGVGGRERSEAEMRRLLAEHGFVVDAIHPLALGTSLFECRGTA